MENQTTIITKAINKPIKCWLCRIYPPNQRHQSTENERIARVVYHISDFRVYDKYWQISSLNVFPFDEEPFQIRLYVAWLMVLGYPIVFSFHDLASSFPRMSPGSPNISRAGCHFALILPKTTAPPSGRTSFLLTLRMSPTTALHSHSSNDGSSRLRDFYFSSRNGCRNKKYMKDENKIQLKFQMHIHWVYVWWRVVVDNDSGGGGWV